MENFFLTKEQLVFLPLIMLNSEIIVHNGHLYEIPADMLNMCSFNQMSRNSENQVVVNDSVDENVFGVFIKFLKNETVDVNSNIQVQVFNYMKELKCNSFVTRAFQTSIIGNDTDISIKHKNDYYPINSHLLALKSKTYRGFKSSFPDDVFEIPDDFSKDDVKEVVKIISSSIINHSDVSFSVCDLLHYLGCEEIIRFASPIHDRLRTMFKDDESDKIIDISFINDARPYLNDLIEMPEFYKLPKTIIASLLTNSGLQLEKSRFIALIKKLRRDHDDSADIFLNHIRPQNGSDSIDIFGELFRDRNGFFKDILEHIDTITQVNENLEVTNQATTQLNEELSITIQEKTFEIERYFSTCQATTQLNEELSITIQEKTFEIERLYQNIQERVQENEQYIRTVQNLTNKLEAAEAQNRNLRANMYPDIHLAAYNNCKEGVEHYLSDPNKVRERYPKSCILEGLEMEGALPLHFAALKGNTEIVKILIQRGALLQEIASKDQRTALHFAAYSGKLNTVQFLVQQGISKTSVDRSGKTAREYAQLKGHRSVEEFLQ